MGWQDAKVVSGGSKAAPSTGAAGWQSAPVVGAKGGGSRAGLPSRQGVAALEALLPIAENLNKYSPAQLIPGFHDAELAARERSRGRLDAAHEAGVKADPWIKAGYQTEVGVPVAIATKNPLLAGGLEGFITSESKDLVGRAVDTARGAGENWLGGKVGERVANIAAPVIDPAVRRLRAMGVRMTPGQVLGGRAKRAEDLAMSSPVVSNQIIEDRTQGLMDFDRGMANRALLPLGIKLPDNVTSGHQAVAFLEDQASKAYQKALPNMRVRPDGRMMAGARSAHKIAATLPDDQHNTFNRIVKETMRFDGNGESFGRPLASMYRDLRDKAYGYMRSNNEADRQLGEALAQLHEGVTSAMRAQNPMAMRMLDRANKAYRGTRVIADAASRAVSGESTVGQMVDAVRRADPTKNKRAMAAGRAFLQPEADAAARVLPSKVPDSGTGPRLSVLRPDRAIIGTAQALNYNAKKGLLPLIEAVRPKLVQQAAALVRDNPAVVGSILGPGFAGLLAGMNDDEER